MWGATGVALIPLWANNFNPNNNFTSRVKDFFCNWNLFQYVSEKSLTWWSSPHVATIELSRKRTCDTKPWWPLSFDTVVSEVNKMSTRYFVAIFLPSFNSPLSDLYNSKVPSSLPRTNNDSSLSFNFTQSTAVNAWSEVKELDFCHSPSDSFQVISCLSRPTVINVSLLSQQQFQMTREWAFIDLSKIFSNSHDAPSSSLQVIFIQSSNHRKYNQLTLISKPSRHDHVRQKSIAYYLAKIEVELLSTDAAQASLKQLVFHFAKHPKYK